MAFRLLASENGFVHVCAHRGHSAGAPENTVAAFQAANARGATTWEIDTMLTRDGTPVVIHDITLDRTTDGSGFVKDATAAEIGALDAGARFGPEFAEARVPTLVEVLDLANTLGAGVELEIKEYFRPDAFIEALAAALAETGTIDQVIALAFDHHVLRAARARIPGLRTEAIIHARHLDPVAVARDGGFDALSIEFNTFHPDDARALHAAGIAIRYNVPKPPRIAHLVACGLDVPGKVGAWLAEGLVDSLSGDDASYLRALVDRYPLANGA